MMLYSLCTHYRDCKEDVFGEHGRNCKNTLGIVRRMSVGAEQDPKTCVHTFVVIDKDAP